MTKNNSKVQQVNGQIELHPYGVILFNKQEQCADTHNVNYSQNIVFSRTAVSMGFVSPGYSTVRGK